ncbi:serine dehydratase subunit alpha family protein [Colidextribacter sp. OB.20]|uniref:L-cysteine desulfidase family protein n=1 Tax=Colidextribacter sp. OB.20 TaxID=2304568 RepID=UPI00136B8850|nr:L-serine ammonia-lyase, iron-sulfur-dependent, subunit alpha [Colidextribacter sp. OB.20]NBI11617.1 serine dehydratase subunit alpha family protein [Colidextribacter sp. OB.20]
MTPDLTNAYLSILKEEMKPAVGCTEPLALAYAAALMRRQLGAVAEHVKVGVSGNIIKNVKSVTIPNTGGMTGIAAAVAAGIVAGDADRELEVIAHVPDDTPVRCQQFLRDTGVDIYCLDSGHPLDILVEGRFHRDTAAVRITCGHTRVVYLAKNDQVLVNIPMDKLNEEYLNDRSVLNLSSIVEFAEATDLTLLKPLFEPQMRMNLAIADYGIEHQCGSGIGRIICGMDSTITAEAMAYAAAGSDARMSGCAMPVVILSGSGNQGLTASVPVVRYGRALSCDEEKILRALAVSSLTTIHLKTGIGKLSAYCGAVCAGCGAGAAIAYLRGADTRQIEMTVSNALGILSGMICDGAKSSCASKIAMSVYAGILAYEMVLHNGSFKPGDGIIGATPEKTVKNVGIIGAQGMRTTDKVILDIMLSQ